MGRDRRWVTSYNASKEEQVIQSKLLKINWGSSRGEARDNLWHYSKGFVHQFRMAL